MAPEEATREAGCEAGCKADAEASSTKITHHGHLNIRTGRQDRNADTSPNGERAVVLEFGDVRFVHRGEVGFVFAQEDLDTDDWKLAG